MTPEDAAKKIILRYWTDADTLRSRGDKEFQGLGVEIAAAIRAAVEKERMEEEFKKLIEDLRTCVGKEHP